ncbi:DUF3016 domain-containing protein [Photobacterium minamisatsumaniensis]|uniref:DUF3016 domain-containing protein n=1 Tax=Photobacterium minamisatsumaniensis TaxID=2910233 RepID=UPI003D0ED119
MRTKQLIVPLLLLGFSNACFADNIFSNPPASVTWLNSDQYKDVKSASGSQSRYEQNVFAQLSKQFGKEANKHLAKDQTLIVTVTDLDLAGMVQYRSELSQEIRILDSTTPPKLSFSYQVKQGDEIVKEGTEQLRNLNYQSSVIGRAKEKPLAYEKALIDKWAKDAL